MRPSRFISFCALATLLSGCSQQAMDTAPEPNETICPEPRPQICTMDYTPVCGQPFAGDPRTYSNGCAACGDDEIRAFVPEACPTS